MLSVYEIIKITTFEIQVLLQMRFLVISLGLIRFKTVFEKKSETYVVACTPTHTHKGKQTD